MSDHIFSVQIAAAEQPHYCQQVADAAIETKQFFVTCREAVSHKFDPAIIATVHGFGDADSERAIMIVRKPGDEAAQCAVDCQRTRLVNNTPTLTARNCHGRPTAMAVSGPKAEFIQLARGSPAHRPSSRRRSAAQRCAKHRFAMHRFRMIAPTRPNEG